MRTNGEFVSKIQNDLKANTKDGRISKRYILHVGKTKAAFLMAQKWDELTMFKEDKIITEIPCFEFEHIDAKYCDIFEFKLCNNLMKSKCKVPETISAKNGIGIVRAFNVDESQNYTYITPQRFQAISKRKYVVKDTRYFYIKDGYMYLPNSTNELLDISVITLDKQAAEKVSSCGYKDDCKSVWDYEFVCPDRFYDLVVRDTIQEIANVWRTSIPDENPNLNENEK